MKEYLKHDEWSIIEEGFKPEYNRISESVFSIGNGHMGMRANFEEQYSGDSLQGSYLAGVYYPDKTRVGWWKNGYPEYFAKVINAPNWIGINIEIAGESLDLAHCEVLDFRRELNMKEGYLERSFTARLKSGKEVAVNAKRFVSLPAKDIGAIRYAIKPLNFSDSIEFTPYLDGDVHNEDSNYDEQFWDEISREIPTEDEGYLVSKTKKTGFVVCTGMKFSLTQGGRTVQLNPIPSEKKQYVSHTFTVDCKEGEETVLFKFGCNVTSRDYPEAELTDICKKLLNTYAEKGFGVLLHEQSRAWGMKWATSDIIIKGDVAAQQGIRFNIFQLNQTYTGEDERLNIGPKGFTGEKYGGVTYWDTEAYCLPFYLATHEPHVAKQLVVYRYKHLQKAIENAEKLGFKNGAALYPMVTINGEECHNEWEITFEEIHRNGAIAFAIFDYIRYTGDHEYMVEYGLEVLIAISRFWAQRVNFSEAKQQYVMLGVTGPNEYENNINNNWYTSTLACWTMKYTIESLGYVKSKNEDKYDDLIAKVNFNFEEETTKWLDILEKMYLGEDSKKGIFLQQDNFYDKELIPAAELPAEETPIHEHWSWDRILRSCYIKQADVLQGIYLFEDQFDKETIERNFDFYEPLTVHESSLSPCVHSILAASIGRREKAYEMYVRTSRLDLDDYNNDTDDGLHITSMAGTWMSVIKGFGGMRVQNGEAYFEPFVPGNWEALAFKVYFRGHLLSVMATKEKVAISNQSEEPIRLHLFGARHKIEPNGVVEVDAK
ncbi:glycoside hydrolase family 65 protein [Flammeovirgaceae bacterium SG7u.111]|nr:glycoside hydrolase family 65 protein [Flammeovirgaceae bacterium SG7u.132]WPO34468.1 glycoside hydrolase family 65 protein [Flammeovirgaceae bacterium SG7u.111]